MFTSPGNTDPHDYEEISARYVDESDVDYEARLESERIRQEELDAYPAVHAALDTEIANSIIDRREQREREWLAAPPPPMDFIDTYADWADQYEVPRAVHEAFAISVIAALLNRLSIRIDCDGYTLPLDFWIGIFAPSGIGKSTARTVGKPVLEALTKLPVDEKNTFGWGNVWANFVDNREWGSKEAFLQQLSGRGIGEGNLFHRFYLWDEMSVELGKFDLPAFAGMKGWMTKLYDSFDLPATVGYSDTNRSSNTPPIEFHGVPRTNIFALTAESWFFRNLDRTDATGGFMPRWTFVDAPGDRWLSRTQRPDPAMVPALARALHEIYSHTVELVEEYRANGEQPNAQPQVQFFDGFWRVPGGPHDKWYRATGPKFVEAFPDMGRAFFNRHRVHVLKLAAVYAASRTRRFVVEPGDWARAVAKATELQATLFRLLKTDMSGTGYTLSRMEAAVERAGPAMLPLHEFTTIFKHETDRKRLLETLLQTEAVSLVKGESTGGRPPWFLVHRNHQTPTPKAGERGR
jgi:hypothetical protein